jgi:hypothetical protein
MLLICIDWQFFEIAVQLHIIYQALTNINIFSILSSSQYGVL